MTAVHPEASRQAVVEAALVLLERMGLTRADLTVVPRPRTPVPTWGIGQLQVEACVDLGPALSGLVAKCVGRRFLQ